MSTFNPQIQETEARYQRCKDQRHERRRHLDRIEKGKKADFRKVDEPGRVLRRLIALGHQELASEAMASMESRNIRVQRQTSAMPEVSLLERILAENNLLGITFLLKGALISRAVGRVVIRSRGSVLGFGTGFLVSPRTHERHRRLCRDSA